MTVEEAKTYLKNYPCICKYGSSPYACKDREGCEFSQAIRTIIDNAPAVEITEEQAINKLHETGWLIGHDKEMTTRPQGDCISREALKEAVSKVVAEERKEDERWAVGLRYALKLIDNAPPKGGDPDEENA